MYVSMCFTCFCKITLLVIGQTREADLIKRNKITSAITVMYLFPSHWYNVFFISN